MGHGILSLDEFSDVLSNLSDVTDSCTNLSTTHRCTRSISYFSAVVTLMSMIEMALTEQSKNALVV